MKREIIQWSVLIAGQLLVVLMAFCIGLQMTALSNPLLSTRFAIGYKWLAFDIVGLAAGLLITLGAIAELRASTLETL